MKIALFLTFISIIALGKVSAAENIMCGVKESENHIIFDLDGYKTKSETINAEGITANIEIDEDKDVRFFISKNGSSSEMILPASALRSMNKGSFFGTRLNGVDTVLICTNLKNDTEQSPLKK